MSEISNQVWRETTPDGVTLEVHRYAPPGGAVERRNDIRAVLLLHGASANRHTFLAPNGGLGEYLWQQGFDVWLLDWRGSSLTVAQNKELLAQSDGVFTFNRAACYDIRVALDIMRKAGVPFPVAAMGHCMGSATLAEAVALARVTPEDIDRIVLQTLGLFYEAPTDSRIKSEDRILERLRQNTALRAINPHVKDPDGTLTTGWDEELEQLFVDWPVPPFHPGPEGEPAHRIANHMCNRVAFMYGMPYHHPNLAPAVHEAKVDEIDSLPNQFGAIPLDMLIHAARNLRQGHATFFDGSDSTTFVAHEARERFRKLRRVTLVTGALNRLWHRTSIDLMHAWLTRGAAPRAGMVRKHVLADYGHQDLLWGEHAPTQVFPLIADGLRW